MNEKLKQLMEQHFQLKKQVDTITEQDDQIKAEIKIIMQDLDDDFIEFETGEAISYKESQRKSLDRKTVESKLTPDIFNECLKVSNFTTLRIMSKEDRARMKRFKK